MFYVLLETTRAAYYNEFACITFLRNARLTLSLQGTFVRYVQDLRWTFTEGCTMLSFTKKCIIILLQCRQKA